MVSNGLVNTVGVNLTHRPINRFTFSSRRITFFAPARLVDSCSLQAVEFSTAITRCSRVHIQIVTVGAIKMGDIFSLPATDTLRAFFFLLFEGVYNASHRYKIMKQLQMGNMSLNTWIDFTQ